MNLKFLILVVTSCLFLNSAMAPISSSAQISSPNSRNAAQTDDLSTYLGFVIGTGPNLPSAQQDANSQMWADIAQICQSEGYTLVYLEILNEEPSGQNHYVIEFEAGFAPVSR